MILNALFALFVIGMLIYLVEAAISIVKHPEKWQ